MRRCEGIVIGGIYTLWVVKRASMEGIFVGLSLLITGRYNLKALMISFNVHFKYHLYKGFLLQFHPVNRMNLLISLVLYTSILVLNDNLPFKVCLYLWLLSSTILGAIWEHDRILLTFVFPVMLSIFLMYSRCSVHMLNCMKFWSCPLKNILTKELAEIFTSQKALELSCLVYPILANRETNNSFEMAK